MKKIILLIMLILFQIPVFSEEFPPTGAGIRVTKETNPIYWGYLEELWKPRECFVFAAGEQNMNLF